MTYEPPWRCSSQGLEVVVVLFDFLPVGHAGRAMDAGIEGAPYCIR